MVKSRGPPFRCPHCGAAYRIARARTKSTSKDRQIVCEVCSAPFRGRRGLYAIRYVLIEQPGKRSSTV